MEVEIFSYLSHSAVTMSPPYRAFIQHLYMSLLFDLQWEKNLPFHRLALILFTLVCLQKYLHYTSMVTY